MTLFESSWVIPVLIVLAIWDIVWKLVAMWHASQNNQRGWFIGLAVINSLGILPILYLFVIQKKVKKS